MAHPGWVYSVRFLPDGRLVSVGGAPRSHGYLATWDVKEGKMLTAEDMALGIHFLAAVCLIVQQPAISATAASPAIKDINAATSAKTPTAK